MQEDLAKEILNIKVKEIDKNTSGLFIDRLNRDTEEIADVFVSYISAISNVISNIGVLLAVFILNKAILPNLPEDSYVFNLQDQEVFEQMI